MLQHKAKWASKILASALVAVLVMAVVCDYKVYIGAVVDSYFAFTIIGATILYIGLFPKWTSVVSVAVPTALFAILDVVVLRYPSTPMVWISLLGVAGFLALLVHAFWSSGEERKRLLLGISLIAPSVALGFAMPSLLRRMITTHPKTLDLYLLSFDSSLKVQLSVTFGTAFAKSLWLAFAGTAFYKALPVPLAVVYAGRLKESTRGGVEALIAFLIAGPLGIVIYNIFPACGPRYLFGASFPFRTLPVAEVSRVLLEPVAIGSYRNGMPSLHFAWVLLAWWYSRKLSIAERIIALVWFVFVGFAILGMGEHWLVDAVVAFPFCVVVRAISAYSLKISDVRRLEPLGFGVGVAAWLVALRYAPDFFWVSPLIPWALVASTVALSILQNAKLDNALDAAHENPTPAVESETHPIGNILRAADGTAR